MTQSLQSILSEREKAFREKIATPAYLLGDAEPIAYHLANVLSFHAETARLVAEAVEKALVERLCNASLTWACDECKGLGCAGCGGVGRPSNGSLPDKILAALRETN